MNLLVPRDKGFTLIELLIVITIIGILSAIGLVTYSYVMKQGRDSKRQSDLRAIQSALEQYYRDQGFYPTSLLPGVTLTNCTGYPIYPCTVTKTYLNKVPTDPTGAYQYKYNGKSLVGVGYCDNVSPGGIPCTSYCLFARLESLSSPDLKGCIDTSGSPNFAVIPP